MAGRRRGHSAAARAAAAAAAAALLVLLRQGAAPLPKALDDPDAAAFVPPQLVHGLGHHSSQRVLAGRQRLAGPAAPAAAVKGRAAAAAEGAPDEEADAHIGFKKTVKLLLSGLMGPALCVGFVRFRCVLNSLVVSRGAAYEITVYVMFSLLAFLLLRSKVLASSAKADVTLACRLMEKLSGGNHTWASETLRKLGPALAAIAQGMLSFLTVNLLVNAIPDNCSWTVPHILRFCDINGDGSLDAGEIESMCYLLTSRLLGCHVILQVARFLNAVRHPPNNPVPESATGPLAAYLRGLQKLRSNQRRRRGEDTGMSDKKGVLLWFADIGLCFLIWAGAFFGWVWTLGIPFSAVAAAVAPLGIGGLAFSLASKSIVQNFISGVLMFANRVFVVGDEIRSLDGKIEGVVARVGMINTEIQRLEGEPLVVPNDSVVNNGIVNLQRRNFWLIDATFPLYMPSFERLREVVEAMDAALKQKVAKEAHPSRTIKAISVYEEPVCYFAGFGHQGATIKARAYVDGTLARHEFYQLKSEILLALNEVAFSFTGAGVGFEAHILSNTTAFGGHGDGHDHGHDSDEGHAMNGVAMAFEGTRVSNGHMNGFQGIANGKANGDTSSIKFVTGINGASGMNGVNVANGKDSHINSKEGAVNGKHKVDIGEDISVMSTQSSNGTAPTAGRDAPGGPGLRDLLLSSRPPRSTPQRHEEVADGHCEETVAEKEP